MVRKVGKYGVNSGNTLRVKNNNCYLRRYGTDSCIIRRAIRRTGDLTVKYDTGLGDDDLKSDGVPFSLNKKGRWSLPELIKREIIDGDHTGDDFGIQLVERHKIDKIANCISLCTSNAEEDGRHERTKRHGYLQISSVLRKQSKYSRRVRRDRLRRGLPVEDNDDEDDDDEQESEHTQVRYDVWYPSPSSCALTRNPKSIKFEIKDFGGSCYAARRRGNRHRQRITKHQMDEAFSILDEEVDDSEEEAYWPSDKEKFSHREPATVTLEDILDQAKSLGNLVGMPGKSRRASGDNKNQAQSTTKKDRIVHLNEEDTTAIIVANTSERTHAVTVRSTQLEPVIVILPFEEITPHALRARFDDCYVESDCFPRKFVLDISDKVSSMSGFKSYRTNIRTVNACLVVTVDGDNEMNTLTDSVCKVVLNTTYSEKMKSVKIETVFDYMETNLDELIGRTLFFIETLPDNSIVMKTDPMPEYLYKGKQGKQTNLEEMSNWSTDSYTVDDGFLLTYFTSNKLDEVTNLGYEVVSHFDTFISNNQSDVSTQDGKFCGICYETIGDENQGTALTSCGHWFCNKCWREHLDAKIRNGSTRLPCPEYDCEKEVDPGTSISFVSMTSILKLAKYRHDTEVERLAVTRWCPNKQCGRVLHVNSTDVIIATCVCGEKCCFDCLGKPHWPADCDSVKLFQKRMETKGDIGIVPIEAVVGVIVNGKNCPHCNRFVEKNGGCPHMVCICGQTFCWGCGKDFNHNNHSNCQQRGYNDKHGTQERNIDPEDKLSKLKRNKWYKVALVHRVGQHPLKYKAMKSAAKPLTKKMKELISRSEQKGSAVSLDFQMAGTVSQRECEKVPDFLTSIIELHREVSQLVENVAVLLDSQRSDKQTLNASLQYMVNRLAYFVNIIYELFMNSNSRDVIDTLTRMKQIRQNSRNVIRALVNIVSREKI